MSFTVYRSSAGSGKTFTLVKEYLQMILPEPEKFRHILAITFTNKVAYEMKERILSNLRELSRPSGEREEKVNQSLLPLLLRGTGLDETEIRKKAAEALERILHNYSDFAVGTIDSFSHRIIRTFAHDFGLPMNFSVEMDADELMQTAVDLLLDRVGDDPDLTGLLVHFLESMMEDEKGWRIEKILLDFSKSLYDEEGKLHLDRLRGVTLKDFDRLAGQVFARKRTFESVLQKLAEKACTLVEKNNIPEDAFAQGGRGILPWFRRIRDGRFDKLAPSDTVRKIVDLGPWHSRKATPADIERIGSVKEELLELFDKIEKERSDHYAFYVLCSLLAKSIYPLAVLNEIDRLLTEFKKQNNIIHISEFNRRIAAIVLNEPVPFIYERTGEWYRHLLIDEFQDTSVLQWNNLLPLVDNSLASGQFNLVVGDGKQAIYRWRNGDVSQFANLPALAGSDSSALIREREQALRNHYREESLRQNFRSKAEIIDFNNRFFTFTGTKLSDENRKIYEGVVQEFRPDLTGGYVRISFTGKGEEDGMGYRDLVLGQILRIIGELKEQGYHRKDITVLCRSNNDATEVAQFLMMNGIPVISAESLLIAFSPEVGFITGFLRLFHEPENPMPKASLVAYLYRTGRIPTAGFHDYIRWIAGDRSSPDAFLAFLAKNGFDQPFERVMLLPVYDLCEELIRIFSLKRTTDPYLRFFLDAVLAYSRKVSSSSAGFLEWWDLNKGKKSVIVPRGLDAVQVMTIHKAKGLQFPVVILPFADQRARYGKSYLWIDLPGNLFPGLPTAMIRPEKKITETEFAAVMEEEENKSVLDLVNLLYVAMTRPEDRLYILSASPPQRSESISVPGLFKSYFESTGEWSEERSVYEAGTMVPAGKAKEPPETGGESLDFFISRPWQERMILRWKAPEIWDPEDPGKNRRWGNLVHSVLAKVRYAKDIPAVMNGITEAGWIEKGRKAELAELITGIVSHPDVRPFFSEGLEVRNEAEILLKDGSVYRPDRVIIGQDRVTVIDYKTGKKDEKYRRQLEDYEKYLKEIGYRDVKKYLLYLEPAVELEEVKD